MAQSKTDAGSAPWPTGDAASGSPAWPLRRRLDAGSLAWLAPFAVAAGYLVLFLVKLPHNVTALGWDPDVGSAFVIPESVARTGTGGHTVMASAGQWVPLWFGLATARLPLHRELWDIAPTLDFLATALIVGWSVSRLASRRAALLAVLIGLVASPMALAFFMAPFSHNTVYPCTALLGAYLIWLTRGEGRRRWLALAVPPLLGVVIGTCLASDLLLAATGVIPLTLVALLALARRERRAALVALSSLATVAVAVPVALATSSIMESSGYLKLPSPVHVATLSELPARAELLFKGLKALFDGFLGTEAPGTLHTELGFASDVAMSAALLALLVVGLLTTVRFVAGALRRRAAAGTPAELARSLHIVYWVVSAASACGAFWVAGEGPTTTHESYYATVIFSVAAVLPLLLSSRSRARWLIPVGATILFVAALDGLTGDYVNVSAVLARSAPNVVRVAEANHVRVGYTNWGDASGLTWGTHEKVIVRPVVECQAPEGIELCPGFQAFVPSWYVPERRRSFLLIDANELELREPPAYLGKPIAVYSFEAMRMYVYSYDIASRLG